MNENELQQINKQIKDKLFYMSSYTNHKGMIGWIRSDTKRADYIYGEITGYFLSFCAYVYNKSNDKNEQHLIKNIISSHIEWLDRSIDEGLKTRYTLSGYSDWRNNAIFSFDLSMIIRGLDDVKSIVPSSLVLIKYLKVLNKCVNTSNTITSVYQNEELELPQKWSTMPDIHLVKAAANMYGIEQ